MNARVRFESPTVWVHSLLLYPIAKSIHFPKQDLMCGENLGAVGEGQMSGEEARTQKKRISLLILDWDGPSISSSGPLSQSGEWKGLKEKEIVLTSHH